MPNSPFSPSQTVPVPTSWMRGLADFIRPFQILFDLGLIALSWLLAYSTRFLLFHGADQGQESIFFFWFFPLAGLSLYFMLKNGLYDWDRLPSFDSEFMQIMRANTIAIVTFVVLLYFVSDGKISRITIVIYAAVSVFLLGLGRAAFRSLARKLRRRGLLLKTVLVIGDGPQVPKYLAASEYSARTGLKVVRVLNEDVNLQKAEAALEDVKPDVVVLGFADEAAPFTKDFIARHYDSLFLTQVLPAERQTLLGLTAESIGDVQLLTLNHPHFSSVETAAKRLLDVLSSGLGLLVLAPFFAVLAIIIKVTSPGPAFYGQERVGLDGRRFKMWKFRSMRIAAVDSSAPGWTVENDPRRTKIGTFMRSTSIDELPQLWNVFVGQMSLVGPRPEQPYFVDKFRSEIPAYMLRHKMKAGITGWAQVNGWRGDTSLHDRIECDLYYIRNWTFWFDIKIIVLTFVKGFVNKNAY